MTIANAIAQKINNDRKTGATGGTLDLSTGTPEDFAPSGNTHDFAIGGDFGVPEYKRKRITGRGIEAWLRPHLGGYCPPVIGWWVEDDTVVLDVTMIWSGTDYEKTKARALEIAADIGERAVFDFTAGEVVPV